MSQPFLRTKTNRRVVANEETQPPSPRAPVRRQGRNGASSRTSTSSCGGVAADSTTVRNHHHERPHKKKIVVTRLWCLILMALTFSAFNLCCQWMGASLLSLLSLSLSSCCSWMAIFFRNERQQRTRTRRERPCALLFFGLAKQFRREVLPSIRKHIVSVNPHCDIFLHNYNLSKITNVRNGENGVSLNANEVYLLTPNVTWSTEEEFLQQHNLTFYREHFPHDAHWEYPTSMDNMIRQWHSISKAWDLMMERSEYPQYYTRVGFFRTDVIYRTDIDIQKDGNAAVIPQFCSKNKFYNDRLFYGNHQYAKIWAKGRFHAVSEFLASPTGQKRQLHSESFMAFLINAKMNLYPLSHAPSSEKRAPSHHFLTLDPSLCFHRVRANGVTLSDDCRLDCGGDTWIQDDERALEKRQKLLVLLRELELRGLEVRSFVKAIFQQNGTEQHKSVELPSPEALVQAVMNANGGMDRYRTNY